MEQAKIREAFAQSGMQLTKACAVNAVKLAYRLGEQHDSIRVEAARPASVLLTLDEQRALLDFAERHQQLSSQRQEELATIIAPTLHIAPSQAVPGVHAIARSILGHI